MRTDIINSMVMGLIFIVLAQNCTAAAPMQLSGGTGRSILESVANVGINNTLNNTLNNTINATNSTANETSNQTASAAETKKGLWGWGKIPVGHSVNQSGKLITNPVLSDPMVEVPAKSPF